MSTHNNNNYSIDLVSEPNTIYESVDSLSPEQRKELMQLEEALVRMQVFAAIDEGNSTPAPGFTETELASMIDNALNGSMSRDELLGLLRQEPELMNTFNQIMTAIHVMEKGKRKPVPGALLNAIKVKPDGGYIPSLVVRLTKDGVRVAKSALKGFRDVYGNEAVSTRSGAAGAVADPTREQLNRSEVTQTFEDRDDFELRYEIIREAENTVTLSLHFEGEKADYRVSLREDGRLIDARVLPHDGQNVSFDHLYPGTYELELSGDMNFQYNIVIEEE